MGQFEVRDGDNCLGYLGFLYGVFPQINYKYACKDKILPEGYQTDQSRDLPQCVAGGRDERS